MRGTPDLRPSGRTRTGIIPAYAGNTLPVANLPRRVRDHPRVCGEHARFFTHMSMISGSSPRMRGTLEDFPAHRPCDGIIPAYAGNTRSAPRNRKPSWDHPRVCGEHRRMKRNPFEIAGSSPRMRGTLRSSSRSVRAIGIIPAYAGNTRAWLVSRLLTRDHPRVCGEHVDEAIVHSLSKGSSPRMRGTPGMARPGALT